MKLNKLSYLPKVGKQIGHAGKTNMVHAAGKSKVNRSSTKHETCLILGRQLKLDLKIQASKEENSTSEIISEASKRYLNERREQGRTRTQT
jgi:hypothetical protein